MSLKHRLKLAGREAWARLLFHTGLHALVDRLMPRRLTILMGHCVDAPELNAHFPRDMKVDEPTLARWLAFFQRHYDIRTVADGWSEIARAEPRAGRRSLLALSMDDGYQDNRTHLLPLLHRLGIPATIYLEENPLELRRVNWTHKLFWTLGRCGPQAYIRRYGELSKDRASVRKLEAALQEGRELYQLKRVLKYEAERADRDATVDALFREQGGDEPALAAQMYMSWEQARELEAAGIELGVHTQTHAILSRCTPEEQRAEIQGCQRRLAERLARPARTLAYPWGRRWDYDQHSLALARESGFDCAVSSHAGTNGPKSDRWQLKRIAIDQDAKLHLLVAEACGGFDLLRRIGLDWSE